MDGTLDTVLEINQQCLEFLSPDRTPSSFPEPCARLSKALSTESRARLAASPYLLADGHFADEHRWRALTGQVDPTLAARLAAPLFMGPGAGDFIRRVLIFGWHMARAHPRHARIVLGMSPSCAELIAKLRLWDLDWLAQHLPGCVRIRWEQQPRIWQHLLRSSPLPDCENLTHAGLRGLQLMAGGTLGKRQ